MSIAMLSQLAHNCPRGHVPTRYFTLVEGGLVAAPDHRQGSQVGKASLPPPRTLAGSQVRKVGLPPAPNIGRFTRQEGWACPARQLPVYQLHNSYVIQFILSRR